MMFIWRWIYADHLDLSLPVRHHLPVGAGNDWQRLAQRVIDRRTALNMTQEDVRKVGGPSTATMRLIEGAHQDGYRSIILARLEQALQWNPGSVRSILDGGEPEPASSVSQPSQPEGVDSWERRLLLRVRDDPDLTDDDRAALAQQIRQVASDARRAEAEAWRTRGERAALEAWLSRSA